MRTPSARLSRSSCGSRYTMIYRVYQPYWRQRMAGEKRDVMIRSFPVDAHERARVAAAARQLTIGEYMGLLVNLHTQLLRRGRKDDALAKSIREQLDFAGLGEIRA